MEVMIRKIGNSKGVIIPAAILEQLQFENKLNLTVEGDSLILKAAENPRQDWFAGYNPALDEDAFSGIKELESEQEDWEW